MERLTACAVNTLLVIIFSFSACCLGGVSDAPFLRLNTEMHTERIGSISTDKAEKLILTCSNDKTARLWDPDTGELIRVLRPPIDQGSGGKLYAGALTADGRFAVVGGWTDDDNCLYLFDTISGAMLRRIGVLPDITMDLEFSPDGRYLAAALGAEYGVRVFRTQDWSEVASLTGYSNNTYRVAFDFLGRLATASWDGKVRLYDATFRLLRERDFGPEALPYSLSFDHQGSRLAVAFLGRPQVEVLNANSLQTLYNPDSPLDELDGIIVSVTFSADGSKLFGGGSYQLIDHPGQSFALRVWEQGGEGSSHDYPLARNTIIDLKALSGNRFLFSSAHPDWGWGTEDGILSLYLYPDLVNPDGAFWSGFKVDLTGYRIGFSSANAGPQTFDFNLRLLTQQTLDAPGYADSTSELVLNEWINTYNPLLNGKRLKYLMEGERNHCADISASQGRILMGADWRLYCLDEKGKLLWKTPMQPTTLAVKASGNGLFAVGMLSDGTIRWYRMSDGKLLLSLFVSRDCRRWVLWTPKGFYDCSPGTENLVGWHVNSGAEHAAMFYPFSQFRDDYYRPDVIDLVLEILDEERAAFSANMLAAEKGFADIQMAGAESREIAASLPPNVSILEPARNSTFSSPEQTLRYAVNSPNGEPVTSLKILLDGRPFQIIKEQDIQTPEGSVRLTLPARNLRLGLIAENRFGKSEMADLKLLWQGDLAPATSKPRLFALAVGVADYRSEGYDLKYAAKDAGDFAGTVSQQQNKLYSRVLLKVLTDSQASRDSILAGLNWLRESCLASDVAMIFLSGHGYNDSYGRFYYLPVAADIGQLKTTGIPFSDFESALAAIPGKVVLFVDACHSGAIYSGEKAPDVTRLVNTLGSDDVGVVIFTSSTPRQVSWEYDAWQNGAFTKALVEGLSGSADFIHDNAVSLKELDLYVSDRVKKLAESIGKTQNPTTIVPQSIPDFDLSLLP